MEYPMNAEKRDFAIEVIAFVASHLITQELFQIEVPTENDLHFAANLSMDIADLINCRFPEATIAWALLQIPDIRESMDKVVGKEKVAALMPRPCGSCRKMEYRVRAIFPYLCSVAAFTAFDIPEGYRGPDDVATWTGTTEALLANRFVCALKWAQDFGIFLSRPCPVCR
jgi:hypothetical protein